MPAVTLDTHPTPEVADMNRIVTSLIILISLATLIASPALAQRGGDDRTIVVSGDAEVRVTPDQIILTLGVSANDMVLAEAKHKSDEKSASLLKALDKQGIAKKDIQSDYIKIEPRYSDWRKTDRDFLGYFVDKTYVVTIRDIDKFEAILSAALESGAEYVHGIQFITTELKKHRDEAREKALQAARTKATNMAAALDMKIGRALSIQENGSRWYMPYNSWGRAGRALLSQTVVQAPVGDTAADGSGTLEPGKISVTANVSVTFELK